MRCSGMPKPWHSSTAAAPPSTAVHHDQRLILQPQDLPLAGIWWMETHQRGCWKSDARSITVSPKIMREQSGCCTCAKRAAAQESACRCTASAPSKSTAKMRAFEEPGLRRDPSRQGSGNRSEQLTCEGRAEVVDLAPQRASVGSAEGARRQQERRCLLNPHQPVQRRQCLRQHHACRLASFANGLIRKLRAHLPGSCTVAAMGDGQPHSSLLVLPAVRL